MSECQGTLSSQGQEVSEESASCGVVSKGLLAFLGFLLCNAKFSSCLALPDYIRVLITWLVCGSFQ